MKIRILDQKYFTNGLVTICKVTCRVVKPVRDYYLCDAAKFFKEFGFYIDESFVITGIAKCNSEDEFDPIAGMILSESRAFRKVYNMGVKITDFMLKDIRRELEEAIDTSERFKRLVEQETSVENYSNLMESAKRRKKAIERNYVKNFHK